MKYTLLIFLCLFSVAVFSQVVEFKSINDRLVQLSDSLCAEKSIERVADNGQSLQYGIVNDSITQVRKGAFEQIEGLILELATKPESFLWFPENLQGIKVIYPQDTTFRMITWIGRFSNNEYQYGGIIQFRSGPPPIVLEPTIIDEDFELIAYDSKNWPSALYYNILDFKRSGQTYYLLFAFDGYQQFAHRKWIDVLSFDDKQTPTFGAAVFDFETESRSKIKRLVLEYAAEINIKLNYDPIEGIIMYDHLIPMKSSYADVEVFVPDGSYEGLRLKRGKWKHIDKIKTLILKDPPRETPILDERKGKSINGQ